MLPSFNLEWRHKSFSFLAAKLWNSLPTYVRNAKDISTFKCLLCSLILKAGYFSVSAQYWRSSVCWEQRE